MGENSQVPVFTIGGERRWRLIKRGTATTATLGLWWVGLLMLALVSLPLLPPPELGSKLTEAAREFLYPSSSRAKEPGGSTKVLRGVTTTSTSHSLSLPKSGAGQRNASQASLTFTDNPALKSAEGAVPTNKSTFTSSNLNNQDSSSATPETVSKDSLARSSNPLQQEPQTPSPSLGSDFSSPASDFIPEYAKGNLLPGTVPEVASSGRRDIATENIPTNERKR